MSYSIKVPKEFNLDHIFCCGQCFRWEKQDDGSYLGTAGERSAFVSLEEGSAGENVLTIDPCTEEEFKEFWHDYFDLDRDYGRVIETLNKTGSVMKAATEYGYGIRLLKQDLWETIVSFIISQNNNIPRIKGIIEKLSRLAGGKIEGPGDFYSIPSADVLSGMKEADLAEIRSGYRAKYLIETAKCCRENGLPETFEELSSLMGVGPKVANCIALFGMGIYDSFPIDTWVRKVMSELYGLDQGNIAGMADFAEKEFGELGGFAQQYLFYYMRERG